MGNFLREDRLKALIAELVEHGVRPDRAPLMADIPEGDEDKHLYAHASICLEYIDTIEQSSKSAAFCLWSLDILQAINNEAGDRKLGQSHFPFARACMDAFCAKIEAKGFTISTIH